MLVSLWAAAGAAPASADMVGGTSSEPAPRLTGVECRVKCAGPMYARAGSTLRLRGANLRDVKTVTFLGTGTPGDDIANAPLRAGATSLIVNVPSDARTGRLAVTTSEGIASKPTPRAIRVESVATRRMVTSGGGPAIELGVSGRKVFLDGPRRPTLTFLLHDPQPVHTVVEVVRVADGVVVASFDQGDVPADQERAVSWDGLINGLPAPEGRYEFRVTAVDQQGVTASSAQAGAAVGQPASPDSFVLLGHKFPIRGRHDYGGFVATFGGGRGHKGQDVFAECGTPIVAARGGTVKMKRYHDRAGNYLVVDGDHTDIDYVYMHLRDEALVEKGDHVHTGQLIGYVGDTGHASGCHLHFELWTGPGWYTGGSAYDPLPELKAWDEFS